MKLKVTKNNVKFIEKDILHSGENGVNQCQFEFSEEYEGLIKKAEFSLNNGPAYLMIINDNECDIPVEVLQSGKLTIGVYGFDVVDDELKPRYSPTPAITHVEKGSFTGKIANEATPSEVEQLEVRLNNKQDKLISGENIKTINNESLLGEGNISLSGIGDMTKEVYDINNNGIVDNAEKVNNHTVQSDVPENAQFTDTIYDDTNIKNNISDIKEEQKNQDKNIAQNTADISTLSNGMINYSLVTETGHRIALEVNSDTYIMTAKLYDKNDMLLSTSNEIDLPIEQMIVNLDFDNLTNELIFVLKNGTTTRVPIGSIISGLQAEITSQNKLSSDLVDDSLSENKFVTNVDKQNWNSKQENLVSGTNIKTINNENILGSGNLSIVGDMNEYQTFYISTVYDMTDYLKKGVSGGINNTNFKNEILADVQKAYKNKKTPIFVTSASANGISLVLLPKTKLMKNVSWLNFYSFFSLSNYSNNYTQVSYSMGTASFGINLIWNNEIPELNPSISSHVQWGGSFIDINNNTFLTAKNTFAYTPTTNYHPATKKYVDDLIGDINTVLATLTTPSNGGGE